MKMGESYTVEYRQERDNDWVFAKHTENLREAQTKANALWDNPDVVEVQIITTTRKVFRHKSRVKA